MGNPRRTIALDYEERKQIESLIKTKLSLCQIAIRIGRSKNAVVAEVKRNGGREVYNAKLAQQGASERMKLRADALSKQNAGKIGKKPRSFFIHRLKALEMQVQILAETLKELLNAKNK